MVKKKKAEMIMFGTRYPPAVLNTMKEIAEQHGRSLNSEVIWALQKYIAEMKGEEAATKAQNQKEE